MQLCTRIPLKLPPIIYLLPLFQKLPIPKPKPCSKKLNPSFEVQHAISENGKKSCFLYLVVVWAELNTPTYSVLEIIPLNIIAFISLKNFRHFLSAVHLLLISVNRSKVIACLKPPINYILCYCLRKTHQLQTIKPFKILKVFGGVLFILFYTVLEGIWLLYLRQYLECVLFWKFLSRTLASKSNCSLALKLREFCDCV